MLCWLAITVASAAEPEAAAPDVLEVEVVTEAAAAEPVGPSLPMESVRTLPGALGDPIRALQGQPGIGRSPYGLGVMLVRGLGPAHQQAWLGEVRLPRALHFGGLGTILDPALLDGVSVVHAAGPVRYGGLGGAVVLEPDDDLRDAVGADASVDLLSARVAAFQPLPDDAELAVAVRRSWVDLALQPFVEDRLGATRLPGTQDAAIRLQRHSSNGHRWQALLIGAQDRLTTTDGVAERAAYEAWLLRLLVNTRFEGAVWTVRTGWSVGPEARSASGGLPVDLSVSGLPLPTPGTVAHEARTSLSGRVVGDRPLGSLRVQVGTEASLEELRYAADDATADDLGLERIGTRTGAAFGELSAPLGPVTPAVGVRAEATSAGRWVGATADPRARVSVRLAPLTRVIGAAGVQHRAPPSRLVAEVPRVETLAPERAVHGSLSAVQGIGPATVRATGFASWLDQLVVGREDLYRFDDPLLPGPRDLGPVRSTGQGRVVGCEAAVGLSDPSTDLWITATVLRSERRSDQDPWHPWAWDQPWNLGLVASRAMGKLRFGTRIRGGAGLPYTPVTNRVVDLEDGDALPLFGAAEAPDRLAPYFTADVRVDWSHPLASGAEVGVFVDVQNATARANEEVVAWGEGWTEVTPVLGLPLLPTAGIRGTL